MRVRWTGAKLVFAWCILLAGCHAPAASSRPPAPSASFTSRWRLVADVPCPVGVEWVAANGTPAWSRDFPPSWLAAGAGACPLAEHDGGPVGARPAVKLEHGERLVVATEAGILLLARATGAVLFQHDLPATDDRPAFFDQGTFTLSGGPSCTGEARHGEVLALCGSRLIVWSMATALLIDVERATVLARTHVLPSMVTHRAHAESDVVIPLAVSPSTPSATNAPELRVHGITYL